jgi:hypothetical protein
MSPILLDLSHADDSAKFNPLPEGTYSAHIVEATMQESKGTGKLPEGTPQIKVRFEVDADDIPEAEKDEKGKTIPYSKSVFSYYAITPKDYANKETMDNILYGFLKAVGYDIDDLKSGKFKFEPEDLAGRKCQLVLSVRDYTSNDGETRQSNNVRYVKAPGAGAALI